MPDGGYLEGETVVLETAAVHAKEHDLLALSQIRFICLDRQEVTCSPVVRAVYRLLDGGLAIPFLESLTVDASLVAESLSVGDDALILERMAAAYDVSPSYVRNCYARLLTTHLCLSNGTIVWGKTLQHLQTRGKPNVTVVFRDPHLIATATRKIPAGAPLSIGDVLPDGGV